MLAGIVTSSGSLEKRSLRQLPVRGERGTMKERKKRLRRGDVNVSPLNCSRVPCVNFTGRSGRNRGIITTQHNTTAQRDTVQLQIVSQIRSLRNVSWKEWEKEEDATSLIGLGSRAARPIIGGLVVRSPAQTAAQSVLGRDSEPLNYQRLHFCSCLCEWISRETLWEQFLSNRKVNKINSISQIDWKHNPTVFFLYKAEMQVKKRRCCSTCNGKAREWS